MIRGSFTAEKQVVAHFKNDTDRWQLKEQEKEVIPTEKIQVIEPDDEFTTLRRVTVGAIPSDYGKITLTGQQIYVE